MAWPTIRTWLAGEEPTAALYNASIRDPLNYLDVTPYSYAQLNANTAAIPATTWTDITTWTVIGSSGITYLAGVFTVPDAGRYAVWASPSIELSATAGVRGVRPVVAGTVRRNVNSAANPNQASSVMFYDEYNMAAGATLKWQVYSQLSLMVRGDAGGQFSGCGIRRIGS
jgi:hypothetical protein